MDDLTPRQRQVLRFIQDAAGPSTACRPPAPKSPRRLASSRPTPPRITCEPCSARACSTCGRAPRAASSCATPCANRSGLPLIGRVAAGRPILAEENIEAHYQIDPQLFQPRPHYLLKVRGMSMKNAGILDGDLVAVHRTPEVRNRQIVVARLENEVTVKRYRQEGTVVWLLPENQDFEPLRVDLKHESLIIEGVVVGVVRQEAGRA